MQKKLYFYYAIYYVLRKT